MNLEYFGIEYIRFEFKCKINYRDKNKFIWKVFFDLYILFNDIYDDNFIVNFFVVFLGVMFLGMLLRMGMMF